MAVSLLDNTGASNYSDSFEPEEELESSASSVGSAIQVASQIKTPAIAKQKSHSQAGAERSTPKPSLVKRVGRPTSRTGVDHKVQSIAGGTPSAAKSFTDSFAVRDAVFSEWLRNKQSRMVNERSDKMQAKKQEEDARREKATERVERVERKVSQWSAAKEQELLEKQKCKKEEQMKQSLQVQEKEEKRQTSVTASESWREEKTKRLVSEHREKKRKARQEEELKRTEVIEKAQSADRAFKVW